MIRELFINVLCLVSVIGGSAATALSIERPVAEKEVAVAAAVETERDVVVAIRPEQLTAWSTAIANSVPVLGAALLLLWGNYRAKKREIDAADAAALQARLDAANRTVEAKSGEIATIKSERDELAAQLKDKSE